MIKNRNGSNITPNQKAKLLIADAIDKLEYWQENIMNDSHLMTDKERFAVNKAVNKQAMRVNNWLGIYQISSSLNQSQE